MKWLSPLKAIRKYCVEYCMSGSEHEVKLCPSDDSLPHGECPLHKLRFSMGVKGVSALKQIRLKCLDCSAYSPDEVKNCQFADCYLYPFRLGHNPILKGKRGKGVSAERMREVRAQIIVNP